VGLLCARMQCSRSCGGGGCHARNSLPWPELAELRQMLARGQPGALACRSNQAGQGPCGATIAHPYLGNNFVGTVSHSKGQVLHPGSLPSISSSQPPASTASFCPTTAAAAGDPALGELRPFVEALLNAFNAAYAGCLAAALPDAAAASSCAALAAHLLGVIHSHAELHGLLLETMERLLLVAGPQGQLDPQQVRMALPIRLRSHPHI
jgi:hypothetical protein